MAYLEELKIRGNIRSIQRVALLKSVIGTHRIARNIRYYRRKKKRRIITDFTIINKKCLLVAVSGDYNITVKKIDRLKKYSDFRIEVVRIRDVQAIIFIVMLGPIPPKLNSYIDKIGIKPSIQSSS